MKSVSVLLPLNLDQSYDYVAGTGAGTDELRLGQFVRVPLRQKQVVGVVWKEEGTHTLPPSKLRPVSEALHFLPPLNKELMSFIDWVADYTMAPRGLVLKLAMSPSALFKEKKRKMKGGASPPAPSPPPPTQPLPVWTAAQEEAIAAIDNIFSKGGYQNVLLEGVTGSGKTEINFQAMMKAIEGRGEASAAPAPPAADAPAAADGQALFLLPEIALANEMRHRFESYSGLPIAIWHSAMTPAKRRDQWLDIAAGKTRIIIGARSALFLPFQNLKLIVVDEEHDEGFKQGEGVIYHARDMAIVRASRGKLPILLSSATPCLETLHNVERHKCQRIKIAERVKPNALLPEIKLIDLRAEKLKTNQWLAAPLVAAMKEGLARKEQTLLFLNRRGFAPLTLCRQCGFRFSCADCTAWLAHHRQRNELLCHHCGLGQEVPKACPQCGQSDGLTPCGPGVERIADEVKKLFPRATTACLSRDLPADINARTEILEQMKQGDIDILIGTQIIAKGHHFPRLTLAGVVDADLGLSNADLRAAERCFQLLQQVAGRTGREHLAGVAFLQTYNPDHPVMQALAANDAAGFIQAEQADRKAGVYPPFGKLAAVILSSEDKAALEAYGKEMADAAPLPSAPEASGVSKLLGPAPAPIFRRAKRYRIRFLVKGRRPLQPFLQAWLKRAPALPHALRRQIDIDPHSFL